MSTYPAVFVLARFLNHGRSPDLFPPPGHSGEHTFVGGVRLVDCSTTCERARPALRFAPVLSFLAPFSGNTCRLSASLAPTAPPLGPADRTRGAGHPAATPLPSSRRERLGLSWQPRGKPPPGRADATQSASAGSAPGEPVNRQSATPQTP